LRFASESPWIAGIDLHIHHVELSDIDGAFEFVEPKIRSDQQILVTEFSLKNLWKLHNSDPIPSILNSKYGHPADWKVYQYLNYSIHHPVTRSEWVEFLQNCPWFEGQKDYLNVAWGKFSGYVKFNVATYGMYQNAPSIFKADTDPWIINPLFANLTVARSPNGAIQTNYTFFDDFRALHP
jgi:hypothetical protein